MTDPTRSEDDDPSRTTRIPTPGSGSVVGEEPASGDAQPAAGWTPPPPAAASAPPPPPPAPPPPATPPQPTGPSGSAWTTAASPAPPTRRPSDRDPGRTASLLTGVIILAIGVWFFLDHTLQLEMPSVRWSQLWPVLLIGIGVWVLLGARRRTR